MSGLQYEIHARRPTHDFTGKGVIVTGAAAGIGRAIATAFAEAGADLVVVDIAVPELDALSSDLAAPGRRVLPLVGDVAEPATCERILEAAAELRSIDVLVNNAGITSTHAPFLETTLADWDRIFAVNLRAVYLVSHAVCRYWVGTGRTGAIVNVSSPGASRAHIHNSIYDATKGGLDALTRAMAVDLGAYGVRVNAIAPAAYRDPPEPRPDVPLGRAATARTVGEAALFLASEAASATTGHVLPVDGGLLAELRPGSSLAEPEKGSP